MIKKPVEGFLKGFPYVDCFTNEILPRSFVNSFSQLDEYASGELLFHVVVEM